ncbi:Alpha/Beta hydrolase protein [Aspergillus karnatakaensis]|uniref:putative ab-hydrolase associated lipase n=1 Tax=Aspergillus karnatakaensis TaxID=1810916 RepID=UPI003CCD7A24
MLITANVPAQDAVTTTVESLYGTAQLPLRKPASLKETTMPSDTLTVEPSLGPSIEPAKQSVLRLKHFDRIPNEGDDDEVSSVTDGLLSDRRPSISAVASQTTVFTLPQHPVFPPLPIYAHPPTAFETIRYYALRVSSFILSLLFLLVIVIGALFRGIWLLLVAGSHKIRGTSLQRQRRFHAEERARRLERRTSSRRWKLRQEKREVDEEGPDDCPPLEGGKDLVVSDVTYYARRIGLDVETFKVQTEDGFVLTLWHVYNPQDYTPLPAAEREHRGAHVFNGARNGSSDNTRRKYPVLLMHGLLQNSGAYCANDDDSLAFFLCKSGYDVWLGNNRCGLEPEHTTMRDNDPRMWSWTIQHMGAFDLTALISRVLFETGYEKLGLVCHSQGTAQTFVALAKDQRPELGRRISVFCALAPAVYAGPLVERVYFKFMRLISPAAFRLVFGIHSFIPFMLTVRRLLHARIYGKLGYTVFSYLFNWSDSRWDYGLRDRMFQFAPVYVSTETIRWWLGADGFSTHQCILATKETCLAEVDEDRCIQVRSTEHETTPSDTAWFGPDTPPLALWVGGSDQLVDGRKLLERLESGREPHVQVAHAKVIEEYEHLDVLWAMDAIEQVGREVRQVLWETMPANARAVSVMPRGVE